jgi:phage shock protein C
VSGERDDSQSRGPQRGDFQRAVDRLESAVEEFVGTANETISSRATRFLDEAAERLEREARNRRRDTRSEPQSTFSTDRPEPRADEYVRESRAERKQRRRHRRRQRRRMDESSEPGYRTTRLYRDTRRQKIAGVCAGLARYFGVESWVVRCVAITGVIFMPSIVIPAYVIAMFVLPKLPNGEPVADRKANPPDHRATAPELGAKLSPRHSLSSAQAALDQVELKLRRMESYVTSGQYELQRELKRIDT